MINIINKLLIFNVMVVDDTINNLNAVINIFQLFKKKFNLNIF